MNIALWIVTVPLATAYLAGGISMLSLSKQRFRDAFEAWHYAEDFPAWMLKAIGVAKVAAAAGLILPAMLDVATWLMPLAALGLVLLMTGATTTRIIRQEWGAAGGDLVFWALAALVAWGRFGPYAF